MYKILIVTLEEGSHLAESCSGTPSCPPRSRPCSPFKTSGTYLHLFVYRCHVYKFLTVYIYFRRKSVYDNPLCPVRTPNLCLFCFYFKKRNFMKHKKTYQHKFACFVQCCKRWLLVINVVIVCYKCKNYNVTK